MSARSGDRIVMALLAVAAVLLLSNLHNGYLWQDEAEKLTSEDSRKKAVLTEIRKLCGDWMQGVLADDRPSVVINAAYQIANLELQRDLTSHGGNDD